MKYWESRATYVFVAAVAAISMVNTACNPVPQVEIRGAVFSLRDDSVLPGAQVQALDPNGAQAGRSVGTGEDGGYVLPVPEFWDPDGDGEPEPCVYTLRVGAAGYIPFPSEGRPAQSLDMADAETLEENGKEVRVFESALTSVGLIRAVIIRGSVFGVSAEGTGAESLAGIAVVAVDANGTPVCAAVLTDESGAYELTVPELWDVDGDGQYTTGLYTVVVATDDYQVLSPGILTDTTIDMSTAVEEPAQGGDILVVENERTSIAVAPSVVIRGQVVDNCDAPVAGAEVAAFDANGVQVSPSVLTDAQGAYELLAPEFWTVEGDCSLSGAAEGEGEGEGETACAFVYGVYTLQVVAGGYQVFPSDVRPAEMIDMAGAVLPAEGEGEGEGEGEYSGFPVVENAATTIMIIREAVFDGLVTEYIEGMPIAGAQVWAVDDLGAIVAGPVLTDAEGHYALAVPQVWDGDGNGEYTAGVYTLEVDAEYYWPYPSNLTPSEPVPVVGCEAAAGSVMTMETIRLAREVVIRGVVLDLADDAPIAGALVQAVDINGTPVGATAETDESGAYALTAPQIWDLDGVLDDVGEVQYGVFMLRCQAMGYQEFPTAIRPSLPIDMSSAAEQQPAEGQTIGELVVDDSVTTLTTIKLIALDVDINLLGSISGHILSARKAGVLVVAAEAGGAAYTGFSGFDGEYAIFNVLEGSYTVEGYALGVQLEPVTFVAMAAGEEKTDVDLAESGSPLSSVSGSVQIVNAPGGSMTSVVLAVESTFDEAAARGVVPPGLRVGEITGAFVIADIPDGRYVVLAAFENDGLVRDPDLNIAGTQIVHIEVPGPGPVYDIQIPDSFKITEALAVVGPGANGPEAVTTATPTLEWNDDSSEDGYEIRVLDSFGNEVWQTEVPGVSGAPTVSVQYAGTPLEEGMYYQFRVQSFREGHSGRSPISTTEDLKGVFYYAPPR